MVCRTNGMSNKIKKGTLSDMFPFVAHLFIIYSCVVNLVFLPFRQDSVAETIVLLADSDLLQLPLEALPIFRHPEIKSVSRDFSLQTFSHRITQGELPGKLNYQFTSIPIALLKFALNSAYRIQMQVAFRFCLII